MTLNIFRSLLLVGLVLLASVPGFAGVVSYDVIIDTTSVATTNGGVYLQFDPGLNADPASVSVFAFEIVAPGTLLGSPAPEFTAGVTGGLDALPLTIPNDLATNYYLHYVTFGTGMSFRVDFNLPDPLTGDSGSTFSFGLTADDGLSPILTSDPSGFIGQIGYDENGVFTPTVLSDAASITNTIPEPASLALFGIGLAAGLAWFRIRGRSR